MADDQNPQLPLGGPNGNSGDGTTPPTGPGAANIISINIEDEMRRSYLDYSMSVIIGRALPDVRDGLKPVHRRILYAMHESMLDLTSHRHLAATSGMSLHECHTII